MKKILTIIMLMVCASYLKAQYVRPAGDNSTTQGTQPGQQTAQQPNDFWSKISIGGSFGLQFGDITFVGISPLINYRVNDDLEIGVGPIYQYYSYTDTYYNYSYSSSIYGGRIVAMYFLPGQLSHLFFIGEYDFLNVPDYYSPFVGITRANIGIPLAGIGIRRPIGEHSYVIITGMWDFSNSALSPYANPIISAGLDLGI